jgi:hypothetical protein
MNLAKLKADFWPPKKFIKLLIRDYRAWESGKVLRPCCNPDCWARRPHWERPDENRGTAYMEVEPETPYNRVFCSYTCACEGGAFSVRTGELHKGHVLWPKLCPNTINCMDKDCDHRSWCVECTEPTRMLPDEI